MLGNRLRRSYERVDARNSLIFGREGRIRTDDPSVPNACNCADFTGAGGWVLGNFDYPSIQSFSTALLFSGLLTCE